MTEMSSEKRGRANGSLLLRNMLLLPVIAMNDGRKGKNHMATGEFYQAGKPTRLAVVQSDAVPRDGDFVCIRDKVWRVCRVLWSIDKLADEDALRANVEMYAYETDAPKADNNER